MLSTVPPGARNSAPSATQNLSSANKDIFIVKGETPEDIVYDFPEVKDVKTSIPLRTIIRQFASSPQIRSVPAKILYMIVGRLRHLLHCVSKYNEGVGKDNDKNFIHYWRRKTLDLLSGFGFQVTHSNEAIKIAGLSDLISSIEKVYADEIEANRELLSNGFVVFDGLAEAYRPFTPVLGQTSGLGGTAGVFQVTEMYYEQHRSLVGIEKSFHWRMEFIVSLGDDFALISFTEVLSGWAGVRARPLSELSYVPLATMSQEDKLQIQDLQKRAKAYVEFAANGPKFVAYSPNTFFIHSNGKNSASMSKSGSSLLSTGGRVIIDSARGAELGHHASQGFDEATNAMIQTAGRYKRTLHSRNNGGNSSDSLLILWKEKIPSDVEIFCWPALVGFSFTAKAWGHVIVSGLEPIVFRDNAFDELVLAPERKQLIQALVRFGGTDTMDDIIGGKRGGSIFLLHGPPGVGKTLTAEAIAEVLHKPLYYVTMGEMGLTPEDMEKRLSDVLDLCAGWDALTLLDEADVFLEQRTSSNDITRNAMVCVMLRLLEYHPGILFLTTNRVKKFDPAFESRVTIALRYESLTFPARIQVWKNLLKLVSIPVASDIVYESLGRHELNGRQIKNAVRLAVALAMERRSSVTQAILETTLEVTNAGRREMGEDDTWKE